MKAVLISTFFFMLNASQQESFASLLQCGAHDQALAALKRDKVIFRASGFQWFLQRELPLIPLETQIGFIDHICTWPLEEGDELQLLFFVGKQDVRLLTTYLKHPQKRYFINHLDKQFFNRHEMFFSQDAFYLLDKHKLVSVQ